MGYLLTRFLTASLYSFIVLCSLGQVLRIILAKKDILMEHKLVLNVCNKILPYSGCSSL